MVLSDRALREAIASGRLHVTPLDETAIQPSSIDLRLGSRFQVFVNQTETHIDPKLNQPDLTKTVKVDVPIVGSVRDGRCPLATSGPDEEDVAVVGRLAVLMEIKRQIAAVG